MTVLATIPAAALAATYASGPHTVETVIKSAMGLGREGLLILWADGKAKGMDATFRLVVETAGLLLKEREAAHAEALATPAPAQERCEGCAGSGVFRYAGCFENGVWKGKEGVCFRCGGKGTQTPQDGRRNRYYDNHVRRVYA